MLKNINSLVRDKAFISVQKRQTKQQTRKFLQSRLRWIRNAEAVSLVAEINGCVVGSASIRRDEKRLKVGHLGISVIKRAQGRGIGTTLMLALMKEARAVLKIGAVELQAYAANHPAIAVYKKCGFVQTDRKRRFSLHYGVWRDRVYMERKF
jgi:putative acetyltransferase